MSWVASGLLMLAAALLQSTLVGRLDPAIPAPNLVLILVVARAWTAGARPAMAWGVGGGLLLDLTGTGPLGLHALALVAAAYAAGALALGLRNESAPISAIGGAVGAGVYAGVVLGVFDFLGLASVPLRAALPLVAWSAAGHALLVPAVVALARRLAGRPAMAPQW